MKVIFIEDVTNVARAGQTKVVADGYARNYLFPRKLAVLANSRAATAVEAYLKKVARKRAIEEAEMAELAKVISGTEITLKAKVGENERLYGSVTGADIAEELSRKIGREVDKRKVDVAEPIRQVGVYDVTIRFTHDITAVVNVTVMSDEEGAARPVKAEKPAGTAEKEPVAEKPEKPKAEKKKKEKPPKEEKTEPEAAIAPSADATAAGKPEEKEAKAEKKEKKVKKEEKKAEKQDEPAKEEKKEKKPKAEKKAKKSEAPVEEEKEK